MAKEKLRLVKDKFGRPCFPSVVPSAAEDILDLMDDAAAYASQGSEVGAPAFDHGSRLFHQLNAHYEVCVARELSEAHRALKRATTGLKVATWWLAAITILLGGVELFKILSNLE